MIVNGRATFEDPEMEQRGSWRANIMLPPRCQQTPIRMHKNVGSAGWMLSEKDGQGEQLDLRGDSFSSPIQCILGSCPA